MLTSKKIVVTGSSGFIGKHLCAELQKSKFSIIRVDFQLLHKSDSETISPEQFLALLQDQNYINQISHILHFGANSNANIETLDKIKYSNIDFTIDMINSVCNRNIYFIFASSAAVYGNDHRVRTNDIRSPYAESKYIIEQFLRSPEITRKLSSTILRLFNIYGKNELVKEHMMSIVSRFVMDALISQKIQIWSLENSPDRPAGSQSRDIMYVQDLATFIIRHLIDEPEKYSNLTIDCGTGNSLSYKDLAKTIDTFLPATIEHVPFPPQFSVENYQWFTRARNDSISTVCPGFKFSTLAETLPSLINAIRNELQHEE